MSVCHIQLKEIFQMLPLYGFMQTFWKIEKCVWEGYHISISTLLCCRLLSPLMAEYDAQMKEMQQLVNVYEVATDVYF